MIVEFPLDWLIFHCLFVFWLQMMDLLTTWWFLKLGLAEGNPLGHWQLDHPIRALFCKLVIVALINTLSLWWPWAKGDYMSAMRCAWFHHGMMGFVVYHNLISIHQRVRFHRDGKIPLRIWLKTSVVEGFLTQVKHTRGVEEEIEEFIDRHHP